MRFVTYSVASVYRFSDDCQNANVITEFGDTAARLGMTPQPPAYALAFSEHRIRAGEPLRFQFNTKNCDLSLRFTPLKDLEYEATYMELYPKCQLTLNQIVEVGGAKERRPVTDVDTVSSCFLLY